MGVGVRACARVFPAAGIRHAAASLWVYKADCQGRGGQGAAHGACHGLCSRRLGHPGPSESESAPTFSRRDGTAGPEHLGILAGGELCVYAGLSTLSGSGGLAGACRQRRQYKFGRDELGSMPWSES